MAETLLLLSNSKGPQLLTRCNMLLRIKENSFTGIVELIITFKGIKLGKTISNNNKINYKIITNKKFLLIDT